MDITKLLGIFREFVQLLQNNYRVYDFNISSWNILENIPFLAFDRNSSLNMWYSLIEFIY